MSHLSPIQQKAFEDAIEQANAELWGVCSEAAVQKAKAVLAERYADKNCGLEELLKEARELLLAEE